MKLYLNTKNIASPLFVLLIFGQQNLLEYRDLEAQELNEILTDFVRLIF